MVLVTYNLELWGEDYTLFSADIDGTATRIDPMDETNVFIVFPADYTSGSSVTIKISNGLFNPSYVATMS